MRRASHNVPQPNTCDSISQLEGRSKRHVAAPLVGLMIAMVVFFNILTFGWLGFFVSIIAAGIFFLAVIALARQWLPFASRALIVVILGSPILCGAMHPVAGSRSAIELAICRNRLKSLSLALLSYHEDFAQFPPSYVADRDGNPAHSWRVLLLPYLDESELYKKYDFNEPWNSERNRKIIELMPSIYRCPSEGTGKKFETSYVGIIGSDTAWSGPSSIKLGEITDDAAQTILLIETANSQILWTEPRDLEITNVLNPLGERNNAISCSHQSRVDDLSLPPGPHVAFVDGTIGVLNGDLNSQALIEFFTISGSDGAAANLFALERQLDLSKARALAILCVLEAMAFGFLAVWLSRGCKRKK